MSADEFHVCSVAASILQLYAQSFTFARLSEVLVIANKNMVLQGQLAEALISIYRVYFSHTFGR